MASIRKLKNGNYQATIYVGRDADGKHLRKYVTKPSLKECKKAAREIEEEIDSKSFVNIKNDRFSEYATKWLNINKNRLAPQTYLSYDMYIRKHFNPYFKRLKLQQINEFHIRDYINKKIEVLSPNTVRKHFFVLKEMFFDVLKNKSPCIGIKPPAPVPFSPKVPTTEEFNTIWEAAKGSWYEMPILLAGWCGMRKGEIFALKPNDLDYKQSTIRIDESRSDSENGYIDKSTKNKQERVVVAPAYLMELLKKHIASKSIIGMHRLFDTRPDSFSTNFGEWIQNKNLPDVTFHALRHYHATYLYEQGIPDKYVADRLGHDIVVLKQIYQHIGVDSEKILDEKIKNMFEIK